jgi:hypothetical protein
MIAKKSARIAAVPALTMAITMAAAVAEPKPSAMPAAAATQGTAQPAPNAAQSKPAAPPAVAPQPVQSKPQFVLLAFDGSKSLDMWEETRAFARDEMKGKVKFTYFISCVYFLAGDTRKKYVEPARGAGKSAIGFGVDGPDIQRRIGQINAAFGEGHEIASHACGHFGGAAKWSKAQWAQEFASFDRFVFGALAENGLPAPAGDADGHTLDKWKVTGFRAPLLETSSGLWSVLREANYRYDTSRTSDMRYQPKKIDGVWNFPLAEVRIAGTAKRTLSMDYNFYYAQSGAKPDPANAARYSKEMLETYLQYFEANYNGARAPLHIGHHFSKWNGGAYWDAMKAFARKVCNLPDVQCVTNAALADYLDKRSSDLVAYAPPSRPPLKLSTAPAPYEIDLDVRVAAGPSGKPIVMAEATGKDIARLLKPTLEMAASVDLSALTLGTPTAKTMDVFSDTLSAHLGRSLRRDFAMAPAAADSAGDFKIVIMDGASEILTQTFSLKDLKIGAHLIPREARALLGDLPEAHLDEGAPDGHPLALPGRP